MKVVAGGYWLIIGLEVYMAAGNPFCRHLDHGAGPWISVCPRTSGRIRTLSDFTANETIEFRDFRQTTCTRPLEWGEPFSVVAMIVGWSPSTADRVARHYGQPHAARRWELIPG